MLLSCYVFLIVAYTPGAGQPLESESCLESSSCVGIGQE
jgi:hypothetical protein